MAFDRNISFEQLETYFRNNPVDGKVRSDEPLSKYTSFHCGGKADFFCDINSIAGLQKTVEFCYKNNVNIRVLGFGTDLLVKDEGVGGAVIRLIGSDFYFIDKVDGLSYRIGSRVSVRKLVKITSNEGLSGLEWFSGIPASVGGALSLNAGAYGHRISDMVEEIDVLLPNGQAKKYDKSELSFGYRKGPFSNGEIILSVLLKFNYGDKETIISKARSIFEERENKLPKGFSAGCVFKNPESISAGALIDQLGLKGASVEEAVISDKHANFIINKANAKSGHVLKLIKNIQDIAKKEKGIDLNLEIKVWGHDK